MPIVNSYQLYMNPMLALFNLGGGEIILILAIVLILFGAKKLPELAKGLGQGIKEFKKATHNVSEEVRDAMAESHPNVPARFEPATVVTAEPKSADTTYPTSLTT